MTPARIVIEMNAVGLWSGTVEVEERWGDFVCGPVCGKSPSEVAAILTDDMLKHLLLHARDGRA